MTHQAPPTSGYPSGAPMPGHLGDVIVRAEGIEKYFGEHHVLCGIDLEVRQREAVMILGRSGSGKTTFLRCINFLEEPTVGAIEVDGLRVEADPLSDRNRHHRERIRQLRMRTGMVFQEFNLFPHMSVIDNLTEAPIRVLGVGRREAIERAEGYLEKVGLGEKRNEYPSRLSGGQKQRVAIARALCMEPKVLLFDEPTSALDPELIGEVLKVMEELAHEGATMIVVTHEMHFAREAADRIVYMEGGVILEQGPPEQMLDEPREEGTRRFLRRFLTPEQLTDDDLHGDEAPHGKDEPRSAAPPGAFGPPTPPSRKDREGRVGRKRREGRGGRDRGGPLV